MAAASPPDTRVTKGSDTSLWVGLACGAAIGAASVYLAMKGRASGWWDSPSSSPATAPASGAGFSISNDGTFVTTDGECSGAAAGGPISEDLKKTMRRAASVRRLAWSKHHLSPDSAEAVLKHAVDAPQFAVPHVLLYHVPDLREKYAKFDAKTHNCRKAMSETLKQPVEYLNYISSDHAILADIVRNCNDELSSRAFVRAGPRKSLYFNPTEVKAAVVTCGGLCPGLNDVIRQITRR